MAVPRVIAPVAGMEPLLSPLIPYDTYAPIAYKFVCLRAGDDNPPTYYAGRPGSYTLFATELAKKISVFITAAIAFLLLTILYTVFLHFNRI